jgi:hypothetical protein
MKYLFSLLGLIIILSSCKKNDVRSAIDCTTITNFSETKEISGFLKHFKLEVPKSWKSELYYDETQSRFYSADTSKQLTDTYIIDVTWHQGEIELNENFERIIENDLKQNEHLTPFKGDFGYFKDLPCYYNLAKGKSSGFTYHYLQIYLKSNVDEYYHLTTKVYGDVFVEERICESLSLFEGLTFHK